MGLDDPRFYFYPDGTTLADVKLNEPISQVDIVQVANADTSSSAGYGHSSLSYGTAMQIRVVLERFRDSDDVRRNDLIALINHLQRGEWVAFSCDHARTWGGNTTSAPGNGDATVTVASNDFSALSASGVVTGGDNVVIQSPNPDGFREQMRVNVYNPGTGVMSFTGGNTITFDHVAETLVRWEWFWPRLILDPQARNSASLLSNEYGNVWTLDLPLLTAPLLTHDEITPQG